MSATKAHPHPIIQIHFKCIQFITNKHRWSLWHSKQLFDRVEHGVLSECRDGTVLRFMLSFLSHVTKWHEHLHARNVISHFVWFLWIDNHFAVFSDFIFPIMRLRIIASRVFAQELRLLKTKPNTFSVTLWQELAADVIHQNRRF